MSYIASRAFAVIGLGVLVGCQSASQASYPAGQQFTLSQSQVATVQRAVQLTLRDPYSAQFGGMQSVRDASGLTTVCGTVNARNGFGGYVGSNFFIGNLSGGTFDGIRIATNDSEKARIFLECEGRGITDWSRAQS